MSRTPRRCLSSRGQADAEARSRSRRSLPLVESLEDRAVPTAVASLADGLLSVGGGVLSDRIQITGNRAGDAIVVKDSGREVARFPSVAVTSILVDGDSGNDDIKIFHDVLVPATLKGGAGNDRLSAGSGNTNLLGGLGDDVMTGGRGDDIFDGGPGADRITAAGGGADFDLESGQLVAPFVLPRQSTAILAASDVNLLLQRAAAASPSQDGIIAVVDRQGRPLGVRVEAGVSPTITSNPDLLVYAIDGAIAKARTGAYFANPTAPLTTRTVQSLSQSTITERELRSIPSIPDESSTLRGPGFVAPLGLKGHFPPEIPNTPQVDLFLIEQTNRDSIIHPGLDRVKGTADDVLLPARFNADPRFIGPGKQIAAPESYGLVSGLRPLAAARGIATLPGGVPIFQSAQFAGGFMRNQFVGGIGVFFPGETGFALEENSNLNDPIVAPGAPDRSLEAEVIAIAAAGGINGPFPIDTLNGVPNNGFRLPNGRIDLVGITLDIFGGHGPQGIGHVMDNARRIGLGTGDPNSGVNLPVTPGPDGIPFSGDEMTVMDGLTVPDGFLVAPHDGVGLTADDVIRIIAQGVNQANFTRAAIRIPLDQRTRMVIGVTDQTGEVLGLYRMPDATYFSIEVAVSKARNAYYYANPALLQPQDSVPGVPPGTAFTARTFRYLSLPRFPEGIDGYPPGPFSILTDGNIIPGTALEAGPPQPAFAFQSVDGYDAFHPSTNFRDPTNILNQSGIVYFPGSAPLYKDTNGDGQPELVGGVGVSGDGVDQDDVVTTASVLGYGVPSNVPRADQVKFRNVRLPYAKFNRQPFTPLDQPPQDVFN